MKKTINRTKIDNNSSKRLKKLRQEIKKSIPLKNDAFMVFAKSKKFCQEFLRVILQDNKLVVISNSIQEVLPSAFNKSVTLDMLCRLKDGSIVNVEIQLTKEKFHAKRIFNYASKIRVADLGKGELHKEARNIIIIYLTEKDIFGKGSTVYEVEMNIVSDQGNMISSWEPGLSVYYVNTEGLTNKTINEYLKLLKDKTTINKKYKITSDIKKDLYGKGGQIMSKEVQAILDAERAEGREEGIAEGIKKGREKGREEGRTEGLIAAVLNMYKKKIIKLSIAADELGMSEKEFLKLAKMA